MATELTCVATSSPLGIVLYEMATGQPPFRGKTAAGIMGSILTESPVKPSALNAAIPARLDRVILKALEKDREARYQSVAHLSADLDEWQRLQPAATSLRTRRWILSAVAASAAGGVFLARRSLFAPNRRIMVAGCRSRTSAEIPSRPLWPTAFTGR
ncbi:MAG: hypothetical protein IT163_06350 [Bryobacterales bacterium]|nr:hypothetical protein [Bryobacterales bacterium]